MAHDGPLLLGPGGLCGARLILATWAPACSTVVRGTLGSRQPCVRILPSANSVCRQWRQRESCGPATCPAQAVGLPLRSTPSGHTL